MDNFHKVSFGLYARKSSVQEDRQCLSIDSQVYELEKYARNLNLSVKVRYTDSASAHSVNNRPQFSRMLDDLAQGVIKGILVYKPCRLARNMIEAGQLIHLLQTEKLKCIVTPNGIFRSTDNMLMLTVELGMANQYSLDLGRVVKRGNASKIRSGGFCNTAPQGYLNNRLTKTIVPDPERFDTLRKLWELYLTGKYSLGSLCKLSDEHYHYRTPAKKDKGGNPLSTSSLHRILCNPFYYGCVRNSESFNENGNHIPMVTKDEFYRVQAILQRHGFAVIRQSTYTFAYRGFIRCGECKGYVTAEEKIKYQCPKCKAQQTAKSEHRCRKCKTKITQKHIRKARHYTYYRCSKKKGKCSQGGIREEALEAHLIKLFDRIEINQKMANWTIREAHSYGKKFKQEQKALVDEMVSQRDSMLLKKQTLMDLCLEGLIDKTEFGIQQKVLEKVLSDISVKLDRLQSESFDWVKALTRDLQLCVKITEELRSGTPDQKRDLMSDLGSNLTLKDENISLELPKPFMVIEKAKKQKIGPFEPTETSTTKARNGDKKGGCPVWSAYVDEIRTFYHEKDYWFSPSGSRI